MVTIMGRVVTPAVSERLNVVQRIRIGAEIVVTYCLARWWLLRLSFAEAVAAARDVGAHAPPALTDEEVRSVGVRLGSAVQRTLRALPVDSRCLVTALVLTRMLARRGIDSSFVLGVRAKPRFAAHAWVERGGVALLPTATEFHRLKVI
jgi:NADPH:quinone reductase-like Zn-dependent oxidoreductase